MVLATLPGSGTESLLPLQWVHGPITVVMPTQVCPYCQGKKLQWVHGPITVVMDKPRMLALDFVGLQWVHGPITVVMGSGPASTA